MADPEPSISTTPRGERRRAAIMDAAAALFARHGYRGASLAAIAESIDLSEPGLLHHFRSKVELLLAVLDERDRQDVADLDARFDRVGLGIFPSLESLVERNAESRDLVRLYTVLVGEAAVSDTHPAHAYFADRYRTISARIRDGLELGKESGEIAADVDCELVARLLLATMDGLQIQGLLDPEFDMARAFRSFSAALARDISA